MSDFRLDGSSGKSASAALSEAVTRRHKASVMQRDKRSLFDGLGKGKVGSGVVD